MEDEDDLFLYMSVANSPGGHGPDSYTVAVTRLSPS